MVRSACPGVAFTGAGMSIESGLSDFRSPGGIWARHQPVISDEFLASREARAHYRMLRVELYREFVEAQPNDGVVSKYSNDRKRLSYKELHVAASAV